MNALDLKGRVAAITGGARGIGLAVAERIAASGGRPPSGTSTWPKPRRSPPGSAASPPGRRRRLCQHRGRARRHRGGARPARHPRRQRRHHRAEHAGRDYPIDAWRQVIDIDLTGVFLCCRAVVPRHVGAQLRPHRQHRLDRRQGRQPQRRRLLAAKAGVIGFTKSLGKELARHDDPGQLRHARGGRDRHLQADDAGAHRLHAVEDPDGPLRPGRGDRRA